MNYSVKLQPEVLDDASSAYSWYEERASGLGDEFLRTFYAAVAGIQRRPTSCKCVHSEFRRMYLRRFPYFLYYRIEDKTIVFILLFHCARHPQRLRRELRKRRDA